MKEKKKIIYTIIVAIIITSYLFTSTCWKNKKATQDSLFQELSNYDLVIKEYNTSLKLYSVGNFSVFKERLQMYNISTVYVEPYSIIDNNYIFYYERMGDVYRSSVEIVSYNLCQYRLNKSIN